MTPKVNLFEKGQGVFKAMSGFASYLAKSNVEKALFHLIHFRVSQINGCAFCLDMHSKDLLAEGESLQRLLVLNAWRETNFYTDRERAALAWAEALTTLDHANIKDALYEEMRSQFSEQELIDVTFAIIAINNYNRLNIAFPNPDVVGTYTPGQFAVN